MDLASHGSGKQGGFLPEDMNVSILHFLQGSIFV